MIDRKSPSIFAHNGLIARSDFESPEWRDLFQVLEEEQNTFLRRENEFRSPQYRWPRTPLHDFSRCFEYPYVFFHLREYRKTWAEKRNPVILDFGSGVTFFPFAVARAGFDVTCLDVDPIITTDIPRAAGIMASSPGTVSCRLTDGRTLPLPDGAADVIFCISVLEHIPWFEDLVAEMARVLKPGGLLVLTFDLRITGTHGLTVAERKTLDDRLGQWFLPQEGDRAVHPSDVLDAFGGPFPRLPSGQRFAVYLLKQMVKMLLRRQNELYSNFAVECRALVKRSP